MIYRNDVSGKKAFDSLSGLQGNSQSPVFPSASAGLTGCGGMPPMTSVQNHSAGVQGSSFIPGGFQNFSHNGNMTGTQIFPSSVPMMPAVGTQTTASSAVPAAPSVSGAVPVQTAPLSEQVPSTLQNTFFTPGFLRTQIGRRVRVEFLLGTNLLTDRTGTLVAVGASYIVLRLVDSDDLMMCDIYSIKFVTILL